jgi:hypothetical protein
MAAAADPSGVTRPVKLILMRAGPHGPGPPAAELRREAAAALGAYADHLENGRRGPAETAGRTALALAVDAFLTDRPNNAELFAAAHRLGDHLSATFTCRYSYDAARDEYERMCPVFALHRGVAHSVELTRTTICSICGAAAFECLHVPGDVYDGELCSMDAERLLPMGGIAFTADPDFLYTWHQPLTATSEEMLEAGLITTAGQDIFCTHCQTCDGLPDPGDLDPVRRYREARAAHAATDDQPEAAS